MLVLIILLAVLHNTAENFLMIGIASGYLIYRVRVNRRELSTSRQQQSPLNVIPIRGAPGEYNSRSIPRDVQMAVMRRDAGMCVICGSTDSLEFGHKVPYSKGGSNSYYNIQLECRRCNRSKGSRLA